MEDLSQLWQSLSGELEARNQRLIAELEGAWQDLSGLLEALEPERAWAAGRKWEAGKLGSLRDLFEDRKSVV